MVPASERGQSGYPVTLMTHHLRAHPGPIPEWRPAGGTALIMSWESCSASSSHGNRTQCVGLLARQVRGCYSPLFWVSPGMSEAGAPGDGAQELTAQVAQKARQVRAQAIARAPQ